MIKIRWQKRASSLVFQAFENRDGRQVHIAYLGSVNPRSLKSKQQFWGQLPTRLRKGALNRLTNAQRQELEDEIAQRVKRPSATTDPYSWQIPEHGEPIEAWIRHWIRHLDPARSALRQIAEAFENPEVLTALAEEKDDAIFKVGLCLMLLDVHDAIPSREKVAALLESLDPRGTVSRCWKRERVVEAEAENV